MHNMKATNVFNLLIPQLIINVDGVNKMRKPYNIKVNKGDIIPGDYFMTSIPETKVIDGLASGVFNEEGGIVYQTIELACSNLCRPTLRKVSVSIDDFKYEDL